MLFVSPRAGIILTTLIIVSDVMHNLLFIAAHGGGSGFHGAVIGNPFVMSQILFLLFVSATAPLAWRAACPKIERTVDARLRQASEPTQM